MWAGHNGHTATIEALLGDARLGVNLQNNVRHLSQCCPVTAVGDVLLMILQCIC